MVDNMLILISNHHGWFRMVISYPIPSPLGAHAGRAQRCQVLLYGDSWAALLHRMAARMRQLDLDHPLLVIAIGAAAPVCRELSNLESNEDQGLNAVIVSVGFVPGHRGTQ